MNTSNKLFFLIFVTLSVTLILDVSASKNKGDKEKGGKNHSHGHHHHHHHNNTVTAGNQTYAVGANSSALLNQTLSKNQTYKFTPIKTTACKDIKTSGVFKNLEISDCPTTPCIFTRGKNSTVKFQFQSSTKLTDLRLNLAGILNNKKVPFPIPDKNHCLDTVKDLKDGKDKKCVIQRNKPYSYEFSLPVQKEYPPVSVYVQYQLTSNNKPIVCFVFAARIV